MIIVYEDAVSTLSKEMVSLSGLRYVHNRTPCASTLSLSCMPRDKSISSIIELFFVTYLFIITPNFISLNTIAFISEDAQIHAASLYNVQ